MSREISMAVLKVGDFVSAIDVIISIRRLALQAVEYRPFIQSYAILDEQQSLIWQEGWAQGSSEIQRLKEHYTRSWLLY